MAHLPNKFIFPTQAGLNIRDHLEDRNAKFNTTVLFKCATVGKITRCIWYKDGFVLKNKGRITMSSSESCHTLTITFSNVDDTGIYSFVAFNDEQSASTHATLFVGPPEGVGTYYYDPPPTTNLKIISHPLPQQIVVGEEIKLKVEVNASDFKCHWCKSNTHVNKNARLVINNDSHFVELVIDQASLTDTGIYYILFYTKSEVISAITNVIVIESLEKFNDTPRLKEPLPEDVEFSERDRRVIMCKANISQDISIDWMKDDERLSSTSTLQTECIYNGILGLTFLSVSEDDVGDYSLVLKNNKTGKTVITSCFVNVVCKPTTQRNMPPVLNKPLQSVVTSIGSCAVFRCSFLFTPRHSYYFVEWQVGMRRVLRTNNLFSVVSQDGDFFLAIKSVDEAMNGEIVCQLRNMTYHETSIVVAKTSAKLTIVPSAKPSKLNKKNNLKHWSGRDGPIFKMEFKYCRLEFGYYIIEVENYGYKKSYPRAVLDEEDTVCYNFYDNEAVVVLEWKPVPGIKSYQVLMLQPDGFFYEAGRVSHPGFTLRYSELEKIYIFRILALIDGTEVTYDLSIIPVKSRSLPPLEKLVKIEKVPELPSFIEDVGLPVGTGGFGRVVLIYNVGKPHQAAKIVSQASEIKRKHANREYELLRVLNHPKVLFLHAAYSTPTELCLVMDYLWGGELFDRLVEEDFFCETDVVYYVKQIVEGLRYVHSLKIMHLDIKPENVVCVSPNSRDIKIIDFGLARGVARQSRVLFMYGTKGFVAPEILSYDHMSPACDMWSLGVLTFMLLSGTTPFKIKSFPHSLATLIYTYEDKAFTNVSAGAKDFCDKLLVVHVPDRITAIQALEHPWLVYGPPRTEEAALALAQENLRLLMSRNKIKWQRVANVVKATCRIRNIGKRSVRNKPSCSRDSN